MFAFFSVKRRLVPLLKSDRLEFISHAEAHLRARSLFGNRPFLTREQYLERSFPRSKSIIRNSCQTPKRMGLVPFLEIDHFWRVNSILSALFHVQNRSYEIHVGRRNAFLGLVPFWKSTISDIVMNSDELV